MSALIYTLNAYNEAPSEIIYGEIDRGRSRLRVKLLVSVRRDI